MISLVFESKRFRVQVNGNLAFVESKERHGWIFRNQYTLPINPKSLRGRGEFAILGAAVRCFERTRSGDRSLMDALTMVEQPIPVETPAAGPAEPLSSSFLPTRLGKGAASQA